MNEQYELDVASAYAYTWGRQDAGDKHPKLDDWQDFGRAYAEHRQRFRDGATRYALPLRDAWASWSTGASIEDWWGGARSAEAVGSSDPTTPPNQSQRPPGGATAS